jgi:hypothetical protein
MFGLFQKRKQIPPFDVLEASANRDKYFIRTAQWRMLNRDSVAVTDPHAPRILTLDPWPQLVFIAADGQRTVKEYVHHAASKYSGNVPGNLDKTILHEIETLLNYGIIALSNAKGRPVTRFDKPLD